MPFKSSFCGGHRAVTYLLVCILSIMQSVLAPSRPLTFEKIQRRAAALGAHHAAVQDQVGVATQHADQHGMEACEQAGLGPGPPSAGGKVASTRTVAVGG